MVFGGSRSCSDTSDRVNAPQAAYVVKVFHTERAIFDDILSAHNFFRLSSAEKLISRLRSLFQGKFVSSHISHLFFSAASNNNPKYTAKLPQFVALHNPHETSRHFTPLSGWPSNSEKCFSPQNVFNFIFVSFDTFEISTKSSFRCNYCWRRIRNSFTVPLIRNLLLEIQCTML